MIDAARKACDGKMTVRALENLTKTVKLTPPVEERKIDSYFKEMEISLNENLGRKVKVEYGKNKGALILEFYDKDDLSEIARRLTE